LDLVIKVDGFHSSLSDMSGQKSHEQDHHALQQARNIVEGSLDLVGLK
jgi:hypothetical protein